MKLEFNLTQNGTYVAEVNVTGDFNLHLETKGGIVNMLQRGGEEGSFAPVTSWSKANVIDCDFGGLVYPKTIKIVSSSEVVNGYVNFNEGGGSGSGSGSSDDKVIYYKFSEPFYLGSGNQFSSGLNFFSGARGFYDIQTYGYYYGTVDTIKGIIGSSFSDFGYIDSFEFRPVQFMKSDRDNNVVIYNDFESLVEAFPALFGTLEFSQITAEEYWEHFNAE